jgi:NADH-quinone oxidoreductase subunit M
VHSYWWINALLLVPLAGALVVGATRAREGAAYVVGVATASVELVLALVVSFTYSGRLLATGAPGAGSMTTFDFAHRVVLAPSFGLAYDVGVDGLSVFLVALTAIVVLLALLGARERRGESAFVAWLLLLSTATIGAFVARDLLEFFLFFELTLIPSYFMIAGWGGPERARAAIKFFVYTLLGSGFLLVGMLYLAFVHQHADGGSLSFSYAVLAATPLSHGVAVWLFVAFALAFAVKSPIWPLHTWSPLAYAEAPTAGSMVLSALLAKLGTYGLLRFCVLLLPAALGSVQPYLMTLAVIGILYGSALAAVAKDLKRLVAYSSLAQVGFIVLGVVSGSRIATAGAVLLMFNHGVITAGFFLLIGFVQRRRGTSSIAELTGLQGVAPVLAGVFTVVMLASIGLPGLSGFVSEYLVLIGTFATHRWWAVVATTGVVFAALYLLWAYQRVFHGRAEGENATMSDLTSRERWVIVPVVFLVVALGVFPRPVLERITPTVHHDVAGLVGTKGATK